MAAADAALTPAASPLSSLGDCFTLHSPTMMHRAASDGGWTVHMSWSALTQAFTAYDYGAADLRPDARVWLRHLGPESGVSLFAALMRELPVPGLAELAPESCPDGLLPEVRRARELQR